jgi:hypothetical protein
VSTDKMNFRKAFNDLNYLNQINPNYKDVLRLMEAKGKAVIMLRLLQKMRLA